MLKKTKYAKKKCAFPGCENFQDSLGYCGKHAQRLRRYGDVNYVTPDHIRIERQRLSMMRNLTISPNNYKKFHGKHEHRIVAEKIIGRKLRSDEVVHHIDGNKHNNKPENLMIMSQSEHIKLHIEQGNGAL